MVEVKEILEYNKKVRHLRGGEATRKKYQVEPPLKTPPSPPALRP